MKIAGFHERPLARNGNPMFGLSNERPILGDNPKAHNEKHCGFHEKRQFL